MFTILRYQRLQIKPAALCHLLLPGGMTNLMLEVYALHLSRDLTYIVGVAPINSTVCNIFHQVMISMLPTRIRRMLEDFR
jgi:hypothetical protein